MQASIEQILSIYNDRAPLSEASTIPAPWYVDPRIAELERLNVFSKTWQLVARTDQLQKPGEFVATRLAGEPIVIVRGSDGTLRAFYNVCRHHAAAVVTQPCGHAEILQCPYHGWKYGLDGSLKGMPEFDGVQNFDRAQNGLVPIRVETWECFVFVNLDPQAAPLNEFLGGLVKRVAPLGVSKLHYFDRRTYDIHCNWKVYVDNFLDGGYHVPHLHKGLSSVLDYKQYTIENEDRYCLQSSPMVVSDEDAATGATRKGDRARYFWQYPNLMINCYEGYMDTNYVIPVDADHCTVIFDFYFSDVSEAARAYNTESVNVGNRVQDEDLGICEDVQRGLKSRAYGAGRLSVRREAGEQLFHQLLAADLKKHPGSPLAGGRLSHPSRSTKGIVKLRFAAVFALTALAPAQVTAIRAGRFVDPDSGTVLTDQVILVRDAKVEKVGKGIDIPPNTKIIDLSKMTVLPGLIDCHTHLADGAHDGEPMGQFKKTAAQVALESVPNARAMLESGFTTVRDVGAYRALGDIALRDAINRGDIVGPRMFVAGAYVTISGGAGALTGLAPDIQLPWDLHYGEANSPWEVRKVVRQLAHDGVDHIKVLSSGAVLTHGSNPKSQEFTPEELQAVVDEAGHFGLRVEAHAHSAEGIKNAIRAGVASVEHATMIDDEGIALAKQHGTYLDMDIYDDECIQEGGRKGKVPKDFLEHDAQLGQIQRDNFRKAVAAGVNMSFGTDAGVCAYGTSGKQFAFMVQYGMTQMQAIQAATSSAADLLGHSNEIGSIKAGKYADIVAVPGDPLADIRLLEDVKFVMKDGKIYKQ